MAAERIKPPISFRPQFSVTTSALHQIRGTHMTAETWQYVDCYASRTHRSASPSCAAVSVGVAEDAINLRPAPAEYGRCHSDSVCLQARLGPSGPIRTRPSIQCRLVQFLDSRISRASLSIQMLRARLSLRCRRMVRA